MRFLLFKRTLFVPFFLLLIATESFAQTIYTYEQHIAPILQTHCNSCHYQKGIGPFVLDNYEDVIKRSKFIVEVTQSGYMPPWRANTDFQHYKNENVLNKEELQIIKDWVQNGQKRGRKRAQDKFVDPHRATLLKGKDTISSNPLLISMRQTFSMPEMGKEEFRFFHIPFQNATEKYIQSIGFKPGNKKLVHHARVMCDTSGTTAGINGMSEADTNIYQFQTAPLSDPFLFGWVPGNDEIRFPEGTGKKLFKHTDFILNMHYAPTPIEATDSSSIVIEWSTKPIEREVITLTLTENNISNQPFYIKANTQPKFFMRSEIVEEDLSFISVMPHMHFLGKNFKVFAVTPEGDLIPLVDIPKWDFNWQMTYTFQKYLKIPKGSVIYAEAQYDNTLDNPLNPYNPLRDVGYGWGTKDEMMNLVIYYVKYKEGDENTKL